MVWEGWWKHRDVQDWWPTREEVTHAVKPLKQLLSGPDPNKESNLRNSLASKALEV
jgi:hypothetical protein